MNINDFAKKIAKRGNGKIQVDTAQIEEILRVEGKLFYEMEFGEVIDTMEGFFKIGKGSE